IKLMGSAPIRRILATNVGPRLAVCHAPADVSIRVGRSEHKAEAWDWIKWLPPVQDDVTFDGDVPARRISSSIAEMADLLAPELDARLDRFQRSRGRQSQANSHLIVFIDGDGHTEQHLLSPDENVPLAA